MHCTYHCHFKLLTFAMTSRHSCQSRGLSGVSILANIQTHTVVVKAHETLPACTDHKRFLGFYTNNNHYMVLIYIY